MFYGNIYLCDKRTEFALYIIISMMKSRMSRILVNKMFTFQSLFPTYKANAPSVNIDTYAYINKPNKKIDELYIETGDQV